MWNVEFNTSDYYLCIWSGVSGSNSPKNTTIALKLLKLDPQMVFKLKWEQIECKIWRWRFAALSVYPCPGFGVLKPSSPNYPDALPGMTFRHRLYLFGCKKLWAKRCFFFYSWPWFGTLWWGLFQIAKIRMLTLLLTFSRWRNHQILKKLWKFQKIKLYLSYFAASKKIM